MPIVTLDQTQNILTNLSPGDKIELTKLLTGEIMVTTIFDTRVQTKYDILRERYGWLMGKPITASEAADKYGVHRSTIFRWIEKGYISVLEAEPVMQLDEAEVKYCVDTYNEKKVGYGIPLFDENGLPYELKHPSLSEYRRRKKSD